MWWLSPKRDSWSENCQSIRHLPTELFGWSQISSWTDSIPFPMPCFWRSAKQNNLWECCTLGVYPLQSFRCRFQVFTLFPSNFPLFFDFFSCFYSSPIVNSPFLFSLCGLLLCMPLIFLWTYFFLDAICRFRTETAIWKVSTDVVVPASGFHSLVGPLSIHGVCPDIVRSLHSASVHSCPVIFGTCRSFIFIFRCLSLPNLKMLSPYSPGFLW
jgi:hypothetical protein